MSLKAVTTSDALVSLVQDEGRISILVHTPEGYTLEVAYFCEEGGLHLVQLDEGEQETIAPYVVTDEDSGSIAVFAPGEEDDDEGGEVEISGNLVQFPA